LGCLFTKTRHKIWDFFEYLAHNTSEYDNARETYSFPSSNPYMMQATPLFESQSDGIAYEHSHAPCALMSCDYCDAFDHDIDKCPLLGRPHILDALAPFNREIYLQSLLQTDLS